MKQIRILNETEAISKSTELIAPPFENGGISLILDEKSCFQEGLEMSNCVYTCYWRDTVKGDYILCKGDINNERFDLGITAIGDDIKFQQVYKRYNIPVLPETEAYCMEWIKSNKDKLLEHVKSIRASKPHQEDRDLFKERDMFVF